MGANSAAMGFARVNGVLLHYRLAGPVGAPVVVLVNALGTDLRIWDDVVARLALCYRVLCYDKRGHGLSDAPAGDYRLEDHVGDLSGLLEHLGIGAVALAGISIGGLIAQGFALAHPGRLSALALCDTAARLGDADQWSARMKAVREEGLEALADQAMARWFGESYRREAPDAMTGWRRLFLRNDPQGYAATCASLRDADLTARVPAIAVSTLVVAGGEDLATPPALVEGLAEAIPDARFALIADAGHIPSIERPDMLAGLIEGFFKEVGHG